MPINELQDLMKQFSQDDQATFEALLERNPTAKADVIARSTLFDAFVSGDDTKLPRVASSTSTSTSAASVDLDALLGNLDRRFNEVYLPKINERLASPDAEKIYEKAAERYFNSRAQDFEANLLGKAAKTSDEVYQIRRTHEREFGSELDTNKFTEYLNANPNKFASLATAHDAYVQEDRIKQRIDKGVAEQVSQRATTAVPGSELPKDGPLGAFIRHNEKFAAASTGATPRGEGIDAGVKAWREMQASRAN